MDPTILLGQVTSTTPYGRDAKLNGFPMKITELLAQLDGTCYVTRQSAETPADVRKTKNALKKAFQNTRLQKGLSFVEVVGTCYSGWKMTPVDANKWMIEHIQTKTSKTSREKARMLKAKGWKLKAKRLETKDQKCKLLFL